MRPSEAAAPAPALSRLGMLALMAAGLAACATLPPPQPATPTEALTDVAETPLARVAKASTDASAGAVDASGFALLPDAAFAFDARIALARRAVKSLDVQYYLIQNDDAGQLLLRELRDAAARGVRVRLLVDDLYTAAEDELFGTLAAHPNVDVRLFNPLPSRADSLVKRILFSLHEFGRINHRMHNKLLVADNSFAVAGGRNIGNDYFMRSASANFIDLDVLAAGPVVRRLSASFDRSWNSEAVWPIARVAPPALAADAARRRFDDLVGGADPDVAPPALDALGQRPVGEQLAAGRIALRPGRVEVFADDPAKIGRSPEEALRGSVAEGALAFITSARERVAIASPYFIPGKLGVARIAEASARGVQSSLVTNSLGATDEPLACAGDERYRADILRAGMRIHEISPQATARSGRFGDFRHSISRLHAKLAVVDPTRVFLGSMNLDHRSAAVNTELGLAIESPALVGDYEALVEGDGSAIGYRLRLAPDGQRVQWVESGADGAEVVHEDTPGRFLWLRFKNWLLLPIVGEELL